MKISFYELLGMIKDNKQPNKVVYNDIVYEWDEQGYYNSIRCEYMSGGLYDTDMLEQNITILETIQIIEDDKDIEELSLVNFKEFKEMCPEERYAITAKEYDVINELVREVNKLKRSFRECNNA